MIHRVSANKTSFHPVEFTTGLNVIVAERTTASTQKDTRNGLGKSTLIEVIDFCLGSSGKGLCIEPLEGWAFTIEITLAGQRVKATRATNAPKKIIIEGPTSGWIEQPDADKISGERIFSPDRWKQVLGWALFGLPKSYDALKYKPSFRSLISYFIRQGSNAYGDPFSHYRQQKTWDIQLHVGFLLGLNWEYAAQWQELKDQEDALNAISKAIETGAMEGALGSVGELEAERVRLETQVEVEAGSLANFKVHPQYEAVQQEADQITSSIHELTNQNVADRRRLARYKESVAEEKPPTDGALERVYEEARFVFPDAVKRTLGEAKEFHQRIVENRKAFLETEIQRLERLIAQRDSQIREKTDARASSLEILRTHGALQEMTVMQEKHLEAKGRLERVRSRISEIKDMTSRKRDVRVAKEELAKVAERDHEQRRDVWSKAVRLFNENSQALYKTPGSLVINITQTGFRYNVEIERSGSEGIGKMKVFCFDLMLLQLAPLLGRRMDFLIHDSVLYDGVDSRQRAQALERAAQVTQTQRTQYICALNSDMIPQQDFSKDFDFKQHVRLSLTDRDPSGSLLGFQFERPGK